MSEAERIAKALDEDERVALACDFKQWSVQGPQGRHISGPAGETLLVARSGPNLHSHLAKPTMHTGDSFHHAARHDPARVLADVERTRRIIGLCETETPETGGLPLALRILRILADEPTPPPPVDGT